MEGQISGAFAGVPSSPSRAGLALTLGALAWTDRDCAEHRARAIQQSVSLRDVGFTQGSLRFALVHDRTQDHCDDHDVRRGEAHANSARPPAVGLAVNIGDERGDGLELLSQRFGCLPLGCGQRVLKVSAYCINAALQALFPVIEIMRVEARDSLRGDPRFAQLGDLLSVSVQPALEFAQQLARFGDDRGC